jgi:hypothetical protein
MLLVKQQELLQNGMIDVMVRLLSLSESKYCGAWYFNGSTGEVRNKWAVIIIAPKIGNAGFTNFYWPN